MTTKGKLLAVIFLLSLIGLGLAGEAIACGNGHGNRWKRFDLNKDKRVDIFDLVIFSAFYGLSEGHPYFWSRCDFNGDGTIDVFDLVMIARFYGYPNKK